MVAAFLLNAAYRHLSLLSRLLKMAMQFGCIAKNPAVGIRKAYENNERHRFLSGEEIARFLLALREDKNTVAANFSYTQELGVVEPLMPNGNTWMCLNVSGSFHDLKMANIVM
jgi:hypothetical protein